MVGTWYTDHEISLFSIITLSMSTGTWYCAPKVRLVSVGAPWCLEAILARFHGVRGGFSFTYVNLLVKLWLVMVGLNRNGSCMRTQLTVLSAHG